jgi:protein required for attachment to host cells
MEPHADAHRELKKKFARQLADALAAELERKSYDHLVIVAPPVALGDLREALSEPVRAKVTGEVPKDLTKTPDPEVAGHLADVLRA